MKEKEFVKGLLIILLEKLKNEKYKRLLHLLREHDNTILILSFTVGVIWIE